jgi:hypothetical protein
VLPEHLATAGNNEPYLHCLLTLFVHSFYYRGDPRLSASLPNSMPANSCSSRC